jgi:hypothetical protein
MFLPAAGFIHQDTSPAQRDYYGEYWISVPESYSQIRYYYFDNYFDTNVNYYELLVFAMSVR